MKILCVFGKYNYGDPKRGEGYEYKNFIPALKRLGHEIIHFDSWDKQLYNNFAELNKNLLCVAEKEKPDLVFCVHILYEVWIETIEILRGWGQCVVNWSTDDDWKYEQFSKLLAPHYDAFATTYPHIYRQYHKDGIENVILTQWAADVNCLQEPLPANFCRYSVSFIGAKYGKRAKWASLLKSRGIDVTCFGYGWENGPILAEEIPKIVQNSVISLNFSDSSLQLKGMIPQKSKQIKARVFEVPGAGGMLLTENCLGIEQYFEIGKEIETFNNLDELVNKINYYLNNHHERDKIANAGNCRTCNEHTYDERMKRLINLAFEIRNMQGNKKVQLDNFRLNKEWHEYFLELEDVHKVSGLAIFLKNITVMIASIFWGKPRGARFVRRVLYELSWRIYGEKTYKAEGLPGRLFYKES